MSGLKRPEDFARLLKLPIHIVRAYIRQLDRACEDNLPCGDKRSATLVLSDQVERQLATLEVPRGTDVNGLYAALQMTSPPDQPGVEERLYRAILQYAEAVIWAKLKKKEDPKPLACLVASDVITQLDRFKGESQFSTYVYRIAANKAFEYMRNKSRERARIGKVLGEQVDYKDALKEASAQNNVNGVDGLLHDIEPHLTSEEYQLLDGILDEKKGKELAEELGVTVVAVYSRRQRLGVKVGKILEARSGKSSSSKSASWRR
jgi:RNA polymerase sigma factor (sigma-70 family)